MAKKYISKYTGPEIDSGLDNIPKLEGKLTELESETDESIIKTSGTLIGGATLTSRGNAIISVDIHKGNRYVISCNLVAKSSGVVKIGTLDDTKTNWIDAKDNNGAEISSLTFNFVASEDSSSVQFLVSESTLLVGSTIEIYEIVNSLDEVGKLESSLYRIEAKGSGVLKSGDSVDVKTEIVKGSRYVISCSLVQKSSGIVKVGTLNDAKTNWIDSKDNNGAEVSSLTFNFVASEDSAYVRLLVSESTLLVGSTITINRLVDRIDESKTIAETSYITIDDIVGFHNKAFSFDSKKNLVLVDRDTRITSLQSFSFPFDVVIKPKYGYQFIVANDNNDVLAFDDRYSDGVMKTEDCFIKAHTLIYITIANTNNTTIQPNNIGNYVIIEGLATKQYDKYLNGAAKLIDSLQKSDCDVNSLLFENKAYNATLGWVDRQTTLVTIQPLKFPYDIIVKTIGSSKLYVFYADDNGNILSFKGWIKGEFVLAKNKTYYLQVAKDDDSIINSSIANQLLYIAPHMPTEVEIAKSLERPIADEDFFVLTKDQVSSGFFIKRSDNGGRLLNIINPYAKKYNHQYMGQLHCHSWIDESTHDQEHSIYVYENYEKLGYDFLSFTNYPYEDDITPCPKYGKMLWLCNSYEQAISHNGQNTHLICLNTNKVFAPEIITGYSANEVIESMDEDKSIISLAHPMWWSKANEAQRTLCSKEQLLQLSDKVKFVEVWNTLSTCEKEDSAYYTNPAYALDVLAAAGRKVFGVAVTDSHGVTAEMDNVMKGGNIKVFAPSLSLSDIWNSLMDGNFYSCDNITASINSIDVVDRKLVIDTGAEDAVTKFYGKEGQILAVFNGRIAQYDILGDEIYVRAEISLHGARVWTNPIFLK